MSSQIDATKPIQGAATTASVRANETTTEAEINAIQGENIGSYSIKASVAGNALTIEVKDAAGIDAAAGNEAQFNFRSSTETSGLRVLRTLAAALSIVVPSGATLGYTANQSKKIYVYAMDDGGTVELGISTEYEEPQILKSPTLISAGSDVADKLYGTVTASDIAIRCIGVVRIGIVTPGTWDAAPDRVETGTDSSPTIAKTINQGGTGANGLAAAQTNLGIQVTEEFTSTDQTITTAGPLTIAHGLSAIPKIVEAFLVCQTTSDGYTAGDVVPIGENSGGSTTGHMIVVDATNINVRFGALATVYALLDFSDGTLAQVANANWKLRIKVWA